LPTSICSNRICPCCCWHPAAAVPERRAILIPVREIRLEEREKRYGPDGGRR
jgi:hypothetical protein